MAVVLAGVGSGGLIWLGESGAAQSLDVVEELVHADLMRVRINGQWEEFPMVPLTDELCRSRDHLFMKYCSDRVLAPEQR
ncbi:MAG: hypothetical protein HYZ27_09575 [Deltaproteobacteria bacterium]|nr:hypothetical protein [Deltaproteobacteria bacterium]